MQMEIPTKDRKIRFSLRVKLVAGFAFLSLLVAAFAAYTFYSSLLGQVQNEFSQRALSIVKVASLQQNGNEFVQISSAEDELYEKFRVQNLKIRYSDDDIVYVYTMRKDERGIYFVVDAGEPGEEGIALYNAVYESPGPALVENFDTMDQAIVEPEIYTDEYGSFLSAYAPIYDDTGEKVGVIAVDILADTIVAEQRRIFFQALYILGVATLIGILFGYVAGNYLSSPIRNLAARTKAFAGGDFSTRVNIKTRDEIEELGQSFNEMASQLQESFGDLEARVEERTREIEESSRNTERRASLLKIIADVASSIAMIQDMDQLLPYITQIVSERFGFYHTGIFLLSADKEYAVLRSANSEGGKAMLARKHQLHIGQEGVVGFAVSQKQAYIALDVGEDAVYFDNPDLPATRSEIALPLIIGGEVIGALDVQSEESNAFSDEDVTALTTLANQLAVAIENTRLFQQSQDALEELNATFQQYLSSEWKQFSTEFKVIGYRAHETGLEPITEEQVQPKSVNANKSAQTIPITLRGATLGMLNVDMGNNSQEYTDEEMSLIQTVADRLALALESARLLEESQKAAAKEQVIGEITGKIGASINMRNVLQTAVEELGRALPGSEIVIQFDTKGRQ